MVKNLTEGKPLPLLFFFAMPMIAGNIFQQLYTMVDTMVVGQFVGADAVAAVGSSYPIVFLSVAIATGLSMGSNVVVSQHFGGGRIYQMKVAVSTAILSQTTLGLLLMLAGALLSAPLLTLLGTDPDVFSDALLYLQIYFGGAAFLLLYNALNGIYNALGDSKTPLMFLMVSSLLNIALDLLFVIRFQMGVSGVAWATLIAQGFCCICSLPLLLFRLRKLPNEEGYANCTPPKFSRDAFLRISRIALPSMLQQSLVSISMLLMQNLVNSYGKVFVAGYTAATKIDSLCLMPNINFANAMSSYTAQNIGAGRQDRVNAGLTSCLILAVSFCLIIAIIVFLFGTQLLSLFLDADEAGSALEYGLDYMHTVSLFYPLMAILFVSNGVLRGSGDIRGFTISSLANLFSRVVLAYLLAYFMDSAAIWWSIPAGWLIGSIVSRLRYRRGVWKNASK